MPKEELSNSMMEIDGDELLQILHELDGKKQVVSEKNGDLRNAIKQVIEDHGWHKAALAQIRAIAAMSETARADFLRTFEPMFEAMNEMVWRQERLDLLDEMEGSEAA